MNRASRDARRLLRRTAPPALAQWIEQFAETLPWPEGPRSLFGVLAAIAVDLGAAYAASGSEVRDLVWSLHKVIRGEPTSRFRGQFSEFEA